MYDTQSFCTGSSQFSAGVGSSKDCKSGVWEDWVVCVSHLSSTSSISVDKGATPQVHEGADSYQDRCWECLSSLLPCPGRTSRPLIGRTGLKAETFSCQFKISLLMLGSCCRGWLFLEDTPDSGKAGSAELGAQ